MGNKMSVGSRQNQATQYLNNPRLPLEITLMIAAQLCPNCSIEEDAIPATEDARELQRALGNLAATCKHLHAVANQHRFHSFVMPYHPDFEHRPMTRYGIDEDVALAQRFNNAALPTLLDRMITHGQLGHQLQYLSIRDFTLQFKAGVTKPRLQRFMATSLNLGIPIPDFVPELLSLPDRTRESLEPIDMVFWLEGQLWLLQTPIAAFECIQFDVWLVRLLLFGSTPRLQKLMIDPKIAKDVFRSRNPPGVILPSVTTMGIPQLKINFPSLFIHEPPRFQMETLLRSFPNLRAFQNDEAAFSFSPYRRTPANSPPLFPNLRRLVLAAEQPGQLHHLTQVLREFPQLEELYYHRRAGDVVGVFDPAFSNANVFNSVHHCLRKLTYLSTTVTQGHDIDDYFIAVECYEEQKFSDVPHFAAFEVLEDLTIDQALLGRLSTVHDRVTSPTGPYFPDLDYRIPQSLRRLTFKSVYDWPKLASQLTALASAKQRGQFPLLSDIFVVIVRTCTVEYDGFWPPHIPLTPSEDLIRDSGELMRAAGINLWASTAEIEAPPGDSEDYPHDVVETGTPVAIQVQRTLFSNI